MDNLIPLFIAIPLGIAFIIPMISRKMKCMPDVLGNLAMLSLVIIAFSTLSRSAPVIYHMGGWDTPLGIDLRLDGLSRLMVLIINVVGLAATIFSVQYMRTYTS